MEVVQFLLHGVGRLSMYEDWQYHNFVETQLCVNSDSTLIPNISTWSAKCSPGLDLTIPVFTSSHCAQLLTEFFQDRWLAHCTHFQVLTGTLSGPRQANLVLIVYASSEGSGEPAHPRSLARTSAARSYKQ